jgi:predicted nucleotide-binding protein (sugar kinase/HSP70/actin superfamily)
VNVPARIVPKSIVSYVWRNYPQTQIIEIERERYGYDVKLSNRIELEFDASGKFIRIDD